MSLQRLPRIVACLVLIASIAMPAMSFARGGATSCDMEGHRCGQQVRACCCHADADPAPAEHAPARTLTLGAHAVVRVPPFTGVPCDDDARGAGPEDVPRHPHGSVSLVVLLATLLI